jgi:DNA-binding transcriptional LysR family regulator
VSGRGSRPSGHSDQYADAVRSNTLDGIRGRLHSALPEVTLHVETADSYVDPVRDGYDLVVRVNPKPDSELVGKCFLQTETVVAAHPGLALPASGSDKVPAVVLTALAG